MNCPRCGSDKVQIQIIQERKYGSFLTFIVRVILFFWIFIVWLLSLLIRTSKIKNKTVAVCSNCGNTWTPKPRKDLARKRKQEKKLVSGERRKELIDSTIESKFWQNEYFGYVMIFLLAPFGVFLMYKYNSRLSSILKKRVAIIALSLWVALLILVAVFGGREDAIDTGSSDQQTTTQTQAVSRPEREATELPDQSKNTYLSALRKCSVMEAADIHTTGVGRKTDNAFNDGRDTCNWMYTDVYKSDEATFASDVSTDWSNRKGEVIDGKDLEYYLSVLGW